MRNLVGGRWVAAWLGLCFVGVARVSAQEINVSEPTAFAGLPAVDELPAFAKKLAPKFPKEVLKSDEPGYAVVSYYADEAGKNRSRFALGTLPAYELAVENALFSAKVAAAKHAGKPVPTWFWFSVIFRPPATLGTAEDAPAQLLAVTPVFVPAKFFDNSKEASLAVPVALTVAADASVTVAQVDARYGKLKPSIETALKAWKFAPARKAGQPVEGTVKMSVVVQSEKTIIASKAYPPKPIKMDPPRYPYALAKSGLIGDVTLEFVINKSGKPQDIVILESNNPGFNDAAIEAVTAWTFQPATVNGFPVNTRVRQKLEFNFDDAGGSTGFTVKTNKPKKGDSAAAAAAVPDVPPKARSTVFAVYPYELLAAETDGSAKIRMLIDDRGRVLHVEVDEATHPEFGLALTAAVEAFAFDAALKDGKPMASVMGMKQDFKRYGSLAMVSPESLDLLRREKKKPESIAKLSALDAPLKPSVTQLPKYPPSLNELRESGSALVEFIVDEEGRVHLPRIVQASKPAFGYAAVQAVSGWRFQPPKAGGKPVVVRVRLPVDFAPDTEEDKK